MVDEATRFSMATLLKGKTASDILSGLTRTWFRLFGARQVLKSDREGGLASEEAAIFWERWSTSLL